MTMEEEMIQPIGRQLLERGGDLLSPGGNVPLCFPPNASTFSSGVCSNQVPRQQWEGTHLIVLASGSIQPNIRQL